MIRSTFDKIGANSRKLLGAVLALLTFLLISMPASAVQPWQIQPEAPDAPEALGSIAGTVTNEANEPLAGIEVAVTARDYYYYEPVYTAVTDSQGRYLIDNLATSIYVVSFSDPANLYRDTYSGDTVHSGQAVAVPVAGNNVTGVDVVMPLATGISGTLSTAVPLSYGSYNVTVYVQIDDGYGYVPYWGYVNSLYLDISETSYSFSSLDPGTYRVCVEAYGEVPLGDDAYDYRSYTECYNDSVTGIQMAEDIIVSESSVVAGIDFVLGESLEYSTISGTVTDPDGIPIPDIPVQTYSNAYPGPAYANAQTKTDENGQYVLDTTLPVSTTVYFDASETIYVSEYYSDAASYDDADVIALEPGTTLDSVDAQLTLGGSITGSLALIGNLESKYVSITLYQESDNSYYPEDGPYFEYYRTYYDAYNVETGQYLIEGLPPGSYYVNVSTDIYVGSYTYLSGYYGGLLYEDALPVVVESGVTTANIDVSFVEGRFDGAIEGRVTSGDNALAGIEVQLLRGDYYYDSNDPYYGGYDPYYDPYNNSYSYGLISYAVTDEDGNYTLGGLTTNSYAIRFVAPNGDYVAELYRDGDDLATISVEDGTTVGGIDGELELAATVSGAIMRTDDQPASYYSIVVELNTEDGRETVRTGHATDENGYYEIPGLPAGDYTLRFLPQYSYATHLRLEVTVEPGETIVGQNGIAGPNVPTSLPTIQEPEEEGPTLTDYLFLPFTMQ